MTLTCQNYNVIFDIHWLILLHRIFLGLGPSMGLDASLTINQRWVTKSGINSEKTIVVHKI